MKEEKANEGYLLSQCKVGGDASEIFGQLLQILVYVFRWYTYDTNVRWNNLIAG